jgi:hypothetical protein
VSRAPDETLVPGPFHPLGWSGPAHSVPWSVGDRAFSHPFVGTPGSALALDRRWGPNPSHPLRCSGLLPWHPIGALGTEPFPPVEVFRAPSLAPRRVLDRTSRARSGTWWFCPWHSEERWDRTSRTLGYSRLCHLCPEERWGPGTSHPVGYSRFNGRGARGALGTEPFPPVRVFRAPSAAPQVRWRSCPSYSLE